MTEISYKVQNSAYHISQCLYMSVKSYKPYTITIQKLGVCKLF